MNSRTDRRLLLVVGLGLAIVPIHNTFLTDLATVNNNVIFFLPTFGYLLLLMGVAFFILYRWNLIKEVGLGDKKIWIPLLVIVAGMGISGVAYGGTIQDKLAPLMMGIAFFGVYVISRVMKEAVFFILAPFVVIGSISIIVSGIVSPGQYTGGFITNYCASAGYLIFGALVYQGKWRLPLILIAGVGLFFIGALEAVFIIGVVGLAVIIRRDFNRKLLYGGIAVLVLIGVWAGLGYLAPLYEGNNNIAVFRDLVTGQIPLNYDTMVALTTGRWTAIVDSVREVNFIGYGYSQSTVGGGIVHNMPLIILRQIGLLAAISWVFVTIYCTIKTKWKYIWFAVIAMGVFDHYLWTQMGPWWWALVGVTTVSGLKSDLIFKKREAA